jgi:putative ATP-dependent endonuclease of the OLD family
LKTFAFYDFKVRKAEKNAEFAANFDINCQTQFANIEQLLVSETPADRHWEMLEAVRDAGEAGSIGIPAQRPAAADLQTLVLGALKSNKGNGFAAQLIDKCSVQELPPTVVEFLRGVYGHFPKPAKPPVLQPIQPPDAAVGGQPNPPPPGK